MRYKIAEGEFPDPSPVQKFGAKRDDGRRKHLGFDLCNGENFNILAYKSGFVRKPLLINRQGTPDPQAGFRLDILHKDGSKTIYTHITKESFKKAPQYVKEGQVLAQAGNTGNPDSIVLHFELHIYGVPVNPFDYIQITSEMTKANGKIKLNNPSRKNVKNVTIYDSNMNVVEKVVGGTVNDFYATKSSNIESPRGNLMFATSEKLDRWVHVRSTSFWGEYYSDSNEAVSEARKLITNALNLLPIVK